MHPPVVDFSPDAAVAVIVTGGSSGIGKSFIEHIGKLRPNTLFCNLSRSVPPREKSSGGAELNLRHFTCDLGNSQELNAVVPEVLAEVAARAPQGPILLINNAGFGGYGVFPAPSVAHQLSMIDLNVRAVVDVTARLLPVLHARGGAVINVASTAAFQPTPYLATYGATKAFILQWSLALREELRPAGIRVLALCPGPTRTQFFQRAGLRPDAVPAVLGQEPAAVVRAALSALRADRGFVVPGWKNRLQVVVAALLPRTWGTWVSGRVLARVRLRQLQAGS